MAEPEEILIEAARHASVFVARLWQRDDADAPDLLSYRHRLELLLAAAYDRQVRLRVAQPPVPPTALMRLFARTPRHLVMRHALPAHDGKDVFLPLRLPIGDPPALALFRLLTFQQAGRLMRNPVPPCIADILARDLFSISEAAAVDNALVTDFPGWAADLLAMRRACLAHRPHRMQFTSDEQRVEDFYRDVLQASPALPPLPLLLAATAADSLAWATATARQLAMDSTPYRGIHQDLWLGTVLPTAGRPPALQAGAPDTEAAPKPQRQARLARRPRVRDPLDNEDDPQEQGMWMLQMDDPQQHVEDPMGMQRPTDRDDGADPGDLSDSLSELPEARLISSPRPAQEILLSDDPPDRRAIVNLPAKAVAGIAYPEWDYHLDGYHPHGAVVRLQIPVLGDPGWADSVLRKRAGLLQKIRRRFESLRPRRVRLDRQRDGDDLDISAYVNAHAERQAGLPLQERWYQSVRPARRDLAIALLIDISGSTDGWVTQDLRIIDVEKEALLIVCRALAALGDPFCIQAFSGEGSDNVALWPLKDFDEAPGTIIERRIAGLEPQHYTRAGAAIRHATHVLNACPARHRLLLILSDGKPNDSDQYEGRYGVEDMRQAVAEAALLAIHPFCLTVDRNAPHYLGRVFGAGRYAVLQQAERLPVVLAEVLGGLIRS